MNEISKSIWGRNYIILLISNAILWLAFEMLAPTLPLFIEGIGGSPSIIGLIIGTLTVSAVLTRPFTSIIMLFMDKKYILIISVTICMLATGSYMLSSGLLILFLFRVIHGVGFGFATVYYMTLAAESLPNDRMGEGMGYLGIGESVCLSLGPLIGVSLLYAYGFNALFASSSVILLVAALMILGVTRPGKDSGVLKKTPKKIVFKFIEKKVLSQSILMLLFGIVLGGVMTFIPLFAKQQGIVDVAWFFFISALIGVITRVLSGKLFDRKGPAFVLVPSIICLIIAVLLIAGSHSVLQLNIAAVFHGIGVSSIITALQAWAIMLVEIEDREAAMSSIFNFLDFGIGGGSFFLGFIAQITSYKAMFFFLAAFGLAYLVLTVFMLKGKRVYPTKT